MDFHADIAENLKDIEKKGAHLPEKIQKRIYFEKGRNMHFIGHLDIMRVFQRAMNRGDIPIAYSKGFNPHQIMSFALPLPVGYFGEAEIIDINLQVDMENELIKSSLNAVLPTGIIIHHVESLSPKSPSAASTLERAVYEVVLPDALREIFHVLDDLLEKDEIIYTRKTRKGDRIENIRAKIFQLNHVGNHLFMEIATGSKSNLRPDVVIEILTHMAYGAFDERERKAILIHCQYIRKKLILS